MSAKPFIYIIDGSVDRTGALEAVRRQAASLTDSAQCVLVVPSANALTREQSPEFAKILRLPMVPLRRSLACVILYLPALLFCGWRLRRMLKADRCTRLQVNDFYLMQGAMARLLGYRGTLLTWIRIDPVRFGRIGRTWLRIARKVSDGIVVVSHFIARQIGEGEGTLLVYDPYPEQRVEPAAPESSERLVFIGNYIRGKGQDVAIAAFARIADRFPNARLELFGGDMGLKKNRAYRLDLEDQARRTSAADRIVFGGFVADTREALRGARAALILSESESFSLTCQEASACGLPVVATRCGGPEEIVEDGVTGFLVEVGDVEATAERMASLLADPALAGEMGRRGAALVAQRFSTDAFRSRVAALFELNAP
jgi:L-malate glycosyltransferase